MAEDKAVEELGRSRAGLREVCSRLNVLALAAQAQPEALVSPDGLRVVTTDLWRCLTELDGLAWHAEDPAAATRAPRVPLRVVPTADPQQAERQQLALELADVGWRLAEQQPGEGYLASHKRYGILHTATAAELRALVVGVAQAEVDVEALGATLSRASVRSPAAAWCAGGLLHCYLPHLVRDLRERVQLRGGRPS